MKTLNSQGTLTFLWLLPWVHDCQGDPERCPDPLKKPRFFRFFKKTKNVKVKLLGFLIFKSEFLLFQINLCKFS